MENNMLSVINEDGVLEEVEVLDFLQLEEYDHEYIVYTKGEEADDDNIVTYVSILEQTSPNEFRFLRITDPEEEKKVDEMIEKDIEELLNERDD